MLKRINRVSSKTISEGVEANLISFFDDGFVEKGGYVNIDIDASGGYTNDVSRLRKVVDPNFPIHDVWQGIENWVYYSGQDIVDGPTNFPPVIKADGAVVSPALTDFRNGRILLPKGSDIVQASYSYKWVSFVSSQDSLNILRFNINDKRHDLQKSQDQRSAEINIPLPVVSFEVPAITSLKPYGLGGPYASQDVSHNITVHIFAERHNEAQRITDIMCMQRSTAFQMYCVNDVCDNNAEPLNRNGSINTGKTFTELSEEYPWLTLKFEDITSTSGGYIGPKLHYSVINMRTRLVSCSVNC